MSEQMKLLHCKGEESFVRQIAYKLSLFGIRCYLVCIDEKTTDFAVDEELIGVLVTHKALKFIPNGYADMCLANDSVLFGVSSEWELRRDIDFAKANCRHVINAPFNPKAICDKIRFEYGILRNEKKKDYRFYTDTSLPRPDFLAYLQETFQSFISVLDVKDLFGTTYSQPATVTILDARITSHDVVALGKALAYDPWYGHEILIFGEKDSEELELISLFKQTGPRTAVVSHEIAAGVIDRVGQRQDVTRLGKSLQVESGGNEMASKTGEVYRWILEQEKRGLLIFGFGIGIQMDATAFEDDGAGRQIRSLSSGIEGEVKEGVKHLGVESMTFTSRIGYKVALFAITEDEIIGSIGKINECFDLIEAAIGMSVLSPMGLKTSILGRTSFQKQKAESPVVFFRRFLAQNVNRVKRQPA